MTKIHSSAPIFLLLFQPGSDYADGETEGQKILTLKMGNIFIIYPSVNNGFINMHCKDYISLLYAVHYKILCSRWHRPQGSVSSQKITF